MIFIFILSTTLLLSHACKTDLDCSLNGVCDVQTGKSVFFFWTSYTFLRSQLCSDAETCTCDPWFSGDELCRTMNFVGGHQGYGTWGTVTSWGGMFFF